MSEHLFGGHQKAATKYRVKVDGQYLPADLDPPADQADAEAIAAWWRARGSKAEVVPTRFTTQAEVETAEAEARELRLLKAGATAFADPMAQSRDGAGDEM